MRQDASTSTRQSPLANDFGVEPVAKSIEAPLGHHVPRVDNASFSGEYDRHPPGRPE